MNSCPKTFGPSEDQLERKAQNRFWEKNQITRLEKLRRKGRKIREEIGYIPSKKQSENYLQRVDEKSRRLKALEEYQNSFSLRKKFPEII